MLGILYGRPKPWLIASLSLTHAHIHANRFFSSTATTTSIFRSVLAGGGYGDQIRRQHLSTYQLGCSSDRIAAASIWHVILPAGNGDVVRRRSSVFYHHNNHQHHEARGEGSWNVAWDARPARWLHNPYSAWWLFGICAVPLPPLLDSADVISGSSQSTVDDEKKVDVFDSQPHDVIHSDSVNQKPPQFKVTGVPADGRCLFRAIAHVACLRRGEEAPDEDRQRELADELRAQVVDELVRRREEAECYNVVIWYIEGDFDVYIERIEKPYVWGGEPELLMASHVIRTPISVYMIDRSSGNLINIAKYGEEYIKNEVKSINVLFHGYGHYDILDGISENVQEDYNKVEA